jgi:hypothetical protein
MGDNAVFAPALSITSTKRRRFFWAGWWTAPPSRVPFRKPDASDGGAETFDDAVKAAEARAGMLLTVIDALWARAWLRILRGQDPWPTRASREPARAATRQAAPESIWSLLGVAQTASLTEIKAAYRKRALELHPDRGGDPETFRRLLAAYAEAQKRAARPKSARAVRRP